MRYLFYLFPLVLVFSTTCGGNSDTQNKTKNDTDIQTANQQSSDVKSMPLIPMMRLLMSDMHTVSEGVYTENYKMIEQGARSIADHPAMTGKDKTLVKSALGEEIKWFVKFDMVVHYHADSTAEAAQQKNINEVLRHYRIVQQGCVDCHSNYRTKIIETKEPQGENK